MALCAMNIKGAMPKLSVAEADAIAETLVAEGWTFPSKPCDHKHWSFKTHGRACSCGVYVMDFGD